MWNDTGSFPSRFKSLTALRRILLWTRLKSIHIFVFFYKVKYEVEKLINDAIVIFKLSRLSIELKADLQAVSCVNNIQV